MNSWIYLFVAFIAEVIATSALKSSDGFSKLWPSLVVISGYGTSFFFFLSLTLRRIPVGVPSTALLPAATLSGTTVS